MKKLFFLVLVITGSFGTFGQTSSIDIKNTSGCATLEVLFQGGVYQNDLCTHFINTLPVAATNLISYNVSTIAWSGGITPPAGTVFHTAWVYDTSDPFLREEKVSVCGPPAAVMPNPCNGATVIVEYQSFPGTSNPDQLSIHN